jgi:hypothetical protein
MMTLGELAAVLRWADAEADGAGYWLNVTLKSGVVVRGPHYGLPHDYCFQIDTSAAGDPVDRVFISVAEIAAIGVELS